jgi:hypothetical protein
VPEGVLRQQYISYVYCCYSRCISALGWDVSLEVAPAASRLLVDATRTIVYELYGYEGE